MAEPSETRGVGDAYVRLYVWRVMCVVRDTYGAVLLNLIDISCTDVTRSIHLHVDLGRAYYYRKMFTSHVHHTAQMGVTFVTAGCRISEGLEHDPLGLHGRSRRAYAIIRLAVTTLRAPIIMGVLSLYDPPHIR